MITYIIYRDQQGKYDFSKIVGNINPWNYTTTLRDVVLEAQYEGHNYGEKMQFNFSNAVSQLNKGKISPSDLHDIVNKSKVHILFTYEDVKQTPISREHLRLVT